MFVAIPYSVCMFVALDMQHAKRMCCILLSPVACLALQNFSTLSNQRNDIQKKTLLNKNPVFLFSPQFFFF